MSQPLFSICIPTRNRAHLLGRALDSCLGQSYKNIEVVVVDNHSSDRTAEIAADYRKRDSRVRFFQNDRNIGQTRNIFKAFESAAGDYVQYLADDNWLARNYAEEKLRCFSEHPETGLVSSRLEKYKISSQGMELQFKSHGASGIMKREFAFRNFYRDDGWFGLLCTARREDMKNALSALLTIPNPYGYDYLETAMVYDVIPFLHILSNYPHMMYTDQTTYFDCMEPSEIENPSLVNLVESRHRYRVAVEHAFLICGAPSYLPPFRRFLGATLAVDILRRLVFGPRRGIGFGTLSKFYGDFSVYDWILSVLETMRVLAGRVLCRLGKS